jgi:hypothetical protein
VIENLNYMKTALEVLEGGTSLMNQMKILKVVKQICEKNIQQIENELIDRVETKLFQGDTNA